MGENMVTLIEAKALKYDGYRGFRHNGRVLGQFNVSGERAFIRYDGDVDFTYVSPDTVIEIFRYREYSGSKRYRIRWSYAIKTDNPDRGGGQLDINGDDEQQVIDTFMYNFELGGDFKRKYDPSLMEVYVTELVGDMPRKEFIAMLAALSDDELNSLLIEAGKR